MALMSERLLLVTLVNKHCHEWSGSLSKCLPMMTFIYGATARELVAKHLQPALILSK